MAIRRRSPTEIAADILRVASGGGTTITALVYRSNSNFIRTRKYVDLLVRRNLLERREDSSGIYRTTPKGEEAMKALVNADQIVFGTRADCDSDRIGLSFARLSSVCRHRDGKTCELTRYECRLENCPIPLIREPEVSVSSRSFSSPYYFSSSAMTERKSEAKEYKVPSTETNSKLSARMRISSSA